MSKNLEAAVIKLCNEERREHGVKKMLKPSKRLRIAANAHARDMVKRDYFDHGTKGGASWSVRIKRIVGTTYATIAENIAYGQDDPSAVVRAWMNSPGHRENILNGDYSHMGLGMYRKGDTEYWVQDLGGN